MLDILDPYARGPDLAINSPMQELQLQKIYVEGKYFFYKN
jgi:hypothetical protein